MQIQDIMSRRVICVEQNASVREAAELMQLYNIGALPVVEKGDVRGMLTDRDIVTRCVNCGQDPNTTHVKEIMTPNATMVRDCAPLSDAVRMMACEQIRRLPVVHGTELVGFLSFADIARLKSDVEVAEAISEISMPQ